MGHPHEPVEGFNNYLNNYPNSSSAPALSSSLQDCCEKTCVHFPCPHGFRTNVAYAKNTGWSPEACCDQTCETFECAEGYRVTTATAQGVNLTHVTWLDSGYTNGTGIFETVLRPFLPIVVVCFSFFNVVQMLLSPFDV